MPVFTSAAIRIQFAALFNHFWDKEEQRISELFGARGDEPANKAST
jgi:hypothetical protein